MRRSAVLLLAVACAGRAPEAQPPTPPPVAEPEAVPEGKPVENVSLMDVGIDPARMDRAADPCEDFYQFACGAWTAKAEIPGDLPQWGASSELKRRNDQVLKESLEEAARDPGDDPALRKLGAYHRACMDEAAIEKAGTRALAPLLKTIGDVRDIPSLAAAIADLHRHRVFVLFRVNAAQDFKDSTQVIANVEQDGLGLPDREYYLRDDEAGKKTREAYVAHVERTFRLLGQNAATARRSAADVMAVDLELARAQKSKVELRDTEAIYNRLDKVGLVRAAPALGWDAYFRAIGRPGVTAVNVEAPAYLEKLDLLLTSIPSARWRSYLTYQLVHDLSPFLPGKFVKEAFTLTQLTSGAKVLQDRWRRCIAYADADVGELAAQPFVKKTLSREARDAARQMIEEVGRAFGRSLTAVAWMDAATQEKAAEKLAKLDFLIGYPDTWRSYDFEIDEKNFAATHLAASRFEMSRRMSKIGNPPDRGEFQRSPQTVNAYYDASLNQMVLLAGILQPPFYNAQASVAVNLGGMGMVVGHELTHGFDDQGALFDGQGNMSSWWPDEVTERFRERTRCVSEAYSKIEVLPGVHINGDLTLGENIADIGGVKMAFRAYRALRKSAPAQQVADGFTEDQQFFISHGQAWCSKETEAYLRLQVTTDPHSPRRYRVNGPLSHNRDFARAFQCKPGARMAPEKICEVW